MKKWLITLSIVALLGVISSATLAGHVYYNELKTYEDYDKKELSEKALQNIYIQQKESLILNLHKSIQI